MKHQYDLIVIGSGPAGFACAMQSAKLGKKVLIIEADQKHLGGSWVNTGTMPSKALREAAYTIQRYNMQFSGKPGAKPYNNYLMADLLSFKNHVLVGSYRKMETDLRNNHVDVFHGYATVVNKNTVSVQPKEGKAAKFNADFILISTGAHTIPPAGFKIDGRKVIDDKTVLEISHIPHRLAIIGYGYDALEYATIFAALGTRVSILSEKETLYPFLDHEIAELLEAMLAEKKIEIAKGVQNISIKENGLRNINEVHYSLKSDAEAGRKYVLEIEYALYLGPKAPNSANLGLDKIGISLSEEKFIRVDEKMRTNIPNIYAAGNVVSLMRSTAVSFLQGRIAACNMFGVEMEGMPANIPIQIQSIPEISQLGLTEHAAAERGLNYGVGRAYYKNNMQNNVHNREHGLLKIVFDTETLKLLGIHILGDNAGDLIHLGQSVMSLNGDIRYFTDNVINYPTLSEAYRIAALNGLNQIMAKQEP